MEKPLSVRREDFAQSLISAVNGSGLPACMALDVLKSLTAEVEALARKQYEADKKQYEESLKEGKDDG